MGITVYTSGVFDLFHAGHLEALNWAKNLGDTLIVGIHSDEDTHSYKRTPIIPYQQRFRIVQNIQFVDQVIYGPLYETEKFYHDLDIDIHCQGEALDGFFKAANKLGILRLVGRSLEAETTAIIQSIVDQENV